MADSFPAGASGWTVGGGASTKLGSSGAGPGSAEMMHSMWYRLSLMYFLKYWTR